MIWSWIERCVDGAERTRETHLRHTRRRTHVCGGAARVRRVHEPSNEGSERRAKPAGQDLARGHGRGTYCASLACLCCVRGRGARVKRDTRSAARDERRAADVSRALDRFYLSSGCPLFLLLRARRCADSALIARGQAPARASSLRRPDHELHDRLLLACSQRCQPVRALLSPRAQDTIHRVWYHQLGTTPWTANKKGKDAGTEKSQ